MEQSSISDNQGQQSTTDSIASPAQAEKMLTQSQVNDIVKGATGRVAEKYRREMEEYKNQISQQNQNTTQQIPNTSNPQLTLDEVRRIAAEEAHRNHQTLIERHQQEVNAQEGKRIVDEFFGKIMSSKEKYPDIEEVIGQLPLDQMADIVGLANGMEGTADIMYDLGKNIPKVALIKSLLSLSPEMGRKGLSDLYKSIQLNNQAKTIKTANAPLNQISASPTSVDNGSMTVSDFRKMFLRRR